MSRARLALADYRDGVVAGDRRRLARAITLVESTRADDRALAQELLSELLPRTGRGHRVGITGTPGVGKSTFIEALGLFLVGHGHRVAVLAVDPSSPLTGGSILGDKTRMERLAREEAAFIRPSPSGGSLGGVANRTRETLLVCEAAGYDVVLVETVGIGQSEMAVSAMVDCFSVLLQPGAGDALQGIKRGALELADLVVVNKADGEQKAAAERARSEYANALELLRPATPEWTPRVLALSSRTGEGIEGYWESVREHRDTLEAAGALERRRRRQSRDWMWTLLDETLLEEFRRSPAVRERIPGVEREVEQQKCTPAAGARALLDAWREGPDRA